MQLMELCIAQRRIFCRSSAKSFRMDLPDFIPDSIPDFKAKLWLYCNGSASKVRNRISLSVLDLAKRSGIGSNLEHQRVCVWTSPICKRSMPDLRKSTSLNDIKLILHLLKSNGLTVSNSVQLNGATKQSNETEQRNRATKQSNETKQPNRAT